MKTLIYSVGVIGGALAGYLYYRFVGCASGRCMITSNPWSSTFYGVMLGAMIASSFVK